MPTQELTGALWRNVKESLQNEIASRRLAPGEEFYSQIEIAEKYGVSFITVKRALKELAHDGWIVNSKGKRPVILKSSAPFEVKVYLPQACELKHCTNFIILRVTLGIYEAAKQMGLKFSTFSNLAFIEDCQEKQCLMFFQDRDLWRPEIDSIIESGKHRVVLVHSYAANEHCSTVGEDYPAAAALATKHLLALGHRRIAFITSTITKPWYLVRFQGYEKALRTAGIKVDLNLVKETHGRIPEEDYEAMDELLRLPQPPTAIFTGDDERAFHVMEYCRKNHIVVPRDLSLIGFDDVPESAYSKPPLTTINTNLTEIGRQTVMLLSDLVNGKGPERNILVEPKLVVRETTAPPESGRLNKGGQPPGKQPG